MAAIAYTAARYKFASATRCLKSAPIRPRYVRDRRKRKLEFNILVEDSCQDEVLVMSYVRPAFIKAANTPSIFCRKLSSSIRTPPSTQRFESRDRRLRSRGLRLSTRICGPQQTLVGLQDLNQGHYTFLIRKR